jgi:hypothetical protein
MGFRLGNRDEWEKGIRMIFLLPAMLVCPFLGAGLLRNEVSPGVGMVIGGAVGGAMSYVFAECFLMLLRFLWPPKQPK